MIKLALIFFLLQPSFSYSATGIKNRLKNFRDPFKRKLQIKSRSRRREKTIRTVFSNKIDPRTILVEDLKIVGIYLGRDRRAIGKKAATKVGEKEGPTFIIKEGMKIGPDQAEVKAILPGGIVLVEKVLNVYDETEFLETIIPITD